MIDYQYLPNMDDPVAKLRSAMDNMDGMCLRMVLILLFILKSMFLSQCKPSARTQSQRKIKATNHLQQLRIRPRM